MKIVEINTVCGIGSTGRICTDIAKILEENHHECKIAYGRGIVPDEYKKYAIKIGNKFDVYLHAGLSRIFDNVGFYSKHATKKFIKWLKDYDPDIIHLHNIHGYYINLKILFNYLKKCNKKIIWTLHDCWSFTGHCSHFDYIKCNKWRDCCNHCPQKNEYPKTILFDNSNKNFILKKQLFTGIKNLTIVTPSQWLANLVKQSFLKYYDVKVIYNGIDLNVFKPTPSNFRQKYNIENKFVILGVANIWTQRKGLNDFIELSKILDNKFQIVLVGLNQEQLKEIPKNIIGIEKTNSTIELAQIYSTANVFVNFTYEDNYPSVNLEAQACGTPVITYDTGGSIESVMKENIVKQGNIKKVKELLINDNFNKKLITCISRNELLIKYFELF